MNPIRQGVKSVLDFWLPRSLWIAHGRRDRRSVALTFDDGPHPEYTPRVLDELLACGIPATFFLVGRNAEKYPQLVRRIVAEGHALGNHSYSHSEPRLTSAAALIAEVVRTKALLEDLTGQPVNLFRPPKGELTLRKMCGAWRAGQTIVLWNVDPRDYLARSSAPLSEWSRRYRPAAGDILLLHDTHEYCAPLIGELAGYCASSSTVALQLASQRFSSADLCPIES